MDIDELLNTSRPPEKTVPLCLRGDLQGEFEDLERRLDGEKETATDSLAGNPTAVELSRQIEALRDGMRTATVTFRLRALPRPKWRELVAAHPSRRDDAGEVHAEDRIGINSETFFPMVIRACLVEPAFSDAQYARLVDEVLTDRQFDLLADAAWGVNRRDVDVPFSRAASRIHRSSAAE